MLIAARLLLCSALLLVSGGANHLRADWMVAGAPLRLVEGRLRLAVDASYPPLALTAADGTLEGLEVDIARELARRLGVPLQLSVTDVGGGLDALIANRYDGILAGLSRSPDLEDRVAFSRPYFDDGPRIIARKSAATDALDGQRVAVELGSAADIAARRSLARGARFTLIHVPDPAAVIAALRLGAADAALLDPASARLAVRSDPTLRQASEPFEPRPLQIALRRANRGLVFAIDAALETMASDGTLDQLADRWFSGDAAG